MEGRVKGTAQDFWDSRRRCVGWQQGGCPLVPLGTHHHASPFSARDLRHTALLLECNGSFLPPHPHTAI